LYCRSFSDFYREKQNRLFKKGNLEFQGSDDKPKSIPEELKEEKIYHANMLNKWNERDDLREKMLLACLDEREEDAEELVDIKLPEDDSKDPPQLNINMEIRRSNEAN